MTSASIVRVKTSFTEIAAEPRALAARFYQALFEAAPTLRSLFPADLTSLQGHFEAALALVVKNLEDVAVLQESLGDLGAQHVHWGARPEDYFVVRDALICAVRLSSSAWSAELESDWREAVTAIIVPMLRGAAVHTAVVAERFANER